MAQEQEMKLRKMEFGKSLRGYNCDEVDTYLAYVNDRYGKLARECSDLRRKMTAMAASQNEFREDALREKEQLEEETRLLREEQQQMIEDAKRKAARILAGAETAAAEILRQAEQQVQERTASLRETIQREEAQAQADSLRKITERNNAAERLIREMDTFRSTVLEMYGKHLEELDRLAEITDRFYRTKETLTAELEAAEPAEPEYVPAAGTEPETENVDTAEALRIDWTSRRVQQAEETDMADTAEDWDVTAELDAFEEFRESDVPEIPMEAGEAEELAEAESEPEAFFNPEEEPEVLAESEADGESEVPADPEEPTAAEEPEMFADSEEPEELTETEEPETFADFAESETFADFAESEDFAESVVPEEPKELTETEEPDAFADFAEPEDFAETEDVTEPEDAEEDFVEPADDSGTEPAEDIDSLLADLWKTVNAPAAAPAEKAEDEEPVGDRELDDFLAGIFSRLPEEERKAEESLSEELISKELLSEELLSKELLSKEETEDFLLEDTYEEDGAKDTDPAAIDSDDFGDISVLAKFPAEEEDREEEDREALDFSEDARDISLTGEFERIYNASQSAANVAQIDRQPLIGASSPQKPKKHSKL